MWPISARAAHATAKCALTRRQELRDRDNVGEATQAPTATQHGAHHDRALDGRSSPHVLPLRPMRPDT
eukprot:14758943-Alexandrium_andersonii.AAC.1